MLQVVRPGYPRVTNSEIKIQLLQVSANENTSNILNSIALELKELYDRQVY